nr:reverse transcriptase domain-containing protein [Tanacetum cinerariifolium]
MSTMANTTPIVTTVTKIATKEKTPNGAETASRINILDFCEEHYEDILPVMDKIRCDKRREAPDMGSLEKQRWKLVLLVRSSNGKTWDKHRYHSNSTGRSSSIKKGRNSESLLSRVSKSGTSEGGRWKSKSKRGTPTDEEDLTVPWSWTARVWFDELLLESIDGYKDLKAAFLAYFMQQKKYIKDPVEIHNIKQKDGETIEDFTKRFKIETRHSGGNDDYHRDFYTVRNHCCFQKESSRSLEVTEPVQALRKQIEELRVTRHKVTQSFAHVKEIMFPPLTANKGTGGPLVIEAEMSGHAVHCIYVDGGSSMEGNYMAAQTVKALGNYRGRRALYKSMDGFYDSEVAITIQRYHWKACDKRNPSSTIHDSQNAQIFATPKDHEKKAEARHKNFKVAIHPDFPDQDITIGGTILIKARRELYTLLKINLDIFVW